MFTLGAFEPHINGSRSPSLEEIEIEAEKGAWIAGWATKPLAPKPGERTEATLHKAPSIVSYYFLCFLLGPFLPVSFTLPKSISHRNRRVNIDICLLMRLRRVIYKLF